MLETISVAVPLLVLVALWVTNFTLKASAKRTLPVALYAVPIIGLALAAAANTAVIVDAGHVGVVTRFGAVTGAIFEQGLNYKMPFVESVWIADVRTQKEQVDAAAASRDLQEVKSTIALNYHLDARRASTVYREIGPQYKQRIVDPAIQEAFKFTTAQFTAEELITQREDVKNRARGFLRDRLGAFNVIVDELNIVTFEFSRAFNDAIEAKQVAAQRVQQSLNEQQRAKVEADTRVIAAQGDAQAVLTRAKAAAEAQQIQRQTLSEIYVQFLAVDKWDGKMPQVTGTGATPFIQIPAR
ncbi:MAG TPA: prohibitin family protein [Candidatus Limnocylindria bacterium]|jgi:regulator of protease activity HflC (stomatin/prohibitin superfamily)|nr:prohibitin family protein [Candidatus Limnocylindria bacterium]